MVHISHRYGYLDDTLAALTNYSDMLAILPHEQGDQRITRTPEKVYQEMWLVISKTLVFLKTSSLQINANIAAPSVISLN